MKIDFVIEQPLKDPHCWHGFMWNKNNKNIYRLVDGVVYSLFVCELASSKTPYNSIGEGIGIY